MLMRELEPKVDRLPTVVDAKKRLLSFRLGDGSHLVMLPGLTFVRKSPRTWMANTDHGKRWVSWTPSGGWRVTKQPPWEPDRPEGPKAA